MTLTLLQKGQTGCPALISLTLLFGLGMPVQSFAISYNVDQKIGVGGVTGVIVTDGTTGILNAGNIKRWNLLLDTGSTRGILAGPNTASRVFVAGSLLTATTHELSFGFSEGTGDFRFRSTSHSDVHWIIHSNKSLPFITGEQVSVGIGSGEQFEKRQGTQVIATTGSASPIPEPSTALLLLTGLAGVAGYRWHQARRTIQ